MQDAPRCCEFMRGEYNEFEFTLPGSSVYPPFEVLRESLDPSSDFVSDLLMVKGPLNTETCVTRPSPVNLFVPSLGCPVMCHGLVGATHLNGKLGEIRQISIIGQPDCRLAVHFEEKSQKPASVKPENLRIVFKLPPLSN